MTTNLEYYKVFYYVATYGSLTVAAAKLNISQPAVSQTIKALEASLNVKLFTRVSKGVSMTREAGVLYEYVKRAFTEIEAGEFKLKEILALDEGEVRIGASDMTLEFFLLPFLESFHVEYPNIKINVTNGPTPETLSNLKNHAVDFGVVSQPLEIPDYFESIPVRDIEDTFVCGRRYLRLRNRTLDYKELEKLPLIMLEHGTSSRKYIDDFLKARGASIEPEFELATSDMIVQFALRNMGVGCVVKDFAQTYIDNGTLFELRFSGLMPKRKLLLVSDKRSGMSHAAKALYDKLLCEVRGID